MRHRHAALSDLQYDPVLGGHRPAALSYLQYDPVALLGSALHGGLGHRLLALAQGHVVQLAQVDGEAQLPA